MENPAWGSPNSVFSLPAIPWQLWGTVGSSGECGWTDVTVKQQSVGSSGCKPFGSVLPRRGGQSGSGSRRCCRACLQESPAPSPGCIALEESGAWLGPPLSLSLLKEMLFPHQAYVWHMKAAGTPGEVRPTLWTVWTEATLLPMCSVGDLTFELARIFLWLLLQSLTGCQPCKQQGPKAAIWKPWQWGTGNRNTLDALLGEALRAIQFRGWQLANFCLPLLFIIRKLKADTSPLWNVSWLSSPSLYLLSPASQAPPGKWMEELCMADPWALAREQTSGAGNSLVWKITSPMVALQEHRCGQYLLGKKIYSAGW